MVNLEKNWYHVFSWNMNTQGLPQENGKRLFLSTKYIPWLIGLNILLILDGSFGPISTTKPKSKLTQGQLQIWTEPQYKE